VPVLEEGEIRMSEQITSADGESQVFDVDLRSMSGEADG
jgi:hypothetical protein